jgi:hypothetical protein
LQLIFDFFCPLLSYASKIQSELIWNLQIVYYYKNNYAGS